MGGADSAKNGEVRRGERGNLKERVYLADSGANGRIILRLNFTRWDMG